MILNDTSSSIQARLAHSCKFFERSWLLFCHQRASSKESFSYHFSFPTDMRAQRIWHDGFWPPGDPLSGVGSAKVRLQLVEAAMDADNASAYDSDDSMWVSRALTLPFWIAPNLPALLPLLSRAMKKPIPTRTLRTNIRVHHRTTTRR